MIVVFFPVKSIHTSLPFFVLFVESFFMLPVNLMFFAVLVLLLIVYIAVYCMYGVLCCTGGGTHARQS